MVLALGPARTSSCPFDTYHYTFLFLPWFLAALMVTSNDLICLTHHCLLEVNPRRCPCEILIFFKEICGGHCRFSLRSCEQLPQQFCCSERASICQAMPLSDPRAQVTRIYFKVFNSFVHICEFEVPQCLMKTVCQVFLWLCGNILEMSYFSFLFVIIFSCFL